MMPASVKALFFIGAFSICMGGVIAFAFKDVGLTLVIFGQAMLFLAAVLGAWL